MTFESKTRMLLALGLCLACLGYLIFMLDNLGSSTLGFVSAVVVSGTGFIMSACAFITYGFDERRRQK